MRRAAGRTLGEASRRPALSIPGPSTPISRSSSSKPATKPLAWPGTPPSSSNPIRERAAVKWARPSIPPLADSRVTSSSFGNGWNQAYNGGRPNPPSSDYSSFGPSGLRLNQLAPEGVFNNPARSSAPPLSPLPTGAGNESAWPVKPAPPPPAWRPRESENRWQPQQSWGYQKHSQQRWEQDVGVEQRQRRQQQFPDSSSSFRFAQPAPQSDARPDTDQQAPSQEGYRQRPPHMQSQWQSDRQRPPYMQSQWQSDRQQPSTQQQWLGSQQQQGPGYRRADHIRAQLNDPNVQLDKKERKRLKEELTSLEEGQQDTRRRRQGDRESTRSAFNIEEEEEWQPQQAPQQQQQVKTRRHKPKIIQQAETVDVFIPTVVSVSNLARILDIRQKRMMNLMERWGMEDVKPDLLLSAEDASLVAVELGYNPVVDDEAAFDIYPDPPHPEPSTLPHRPPVVTIMGHVDHGKTTLLDTLRSTSVAKGEAGGITQHIGAFSVPVPNATADSAIKTITFLDTPGHAAFTAMRARGAHVTDIIVCVVAADDGVMPQTREVLNLAKSENNVQLVIAVNKIDKPGADADKIKNALMIEGVQVEDLNGDVPCVEVSGLTGQGLDTLIETISTMAEVADLRAEQTSKAEGHVLESRVDKGRGPIATILVARGTLRSGDSIVAGTTWCRVRQMMDDKGNLVKEAIPGMPVTVAGWKELPEAGDEVLQAVKGEGDAKQAIDNRQRELEKRKLLEDVLKINESRKAERLDREEAAHAEHTGVDRETPEEHKGPKELRLVIKGDVSGTVEAVVGSVSGIGNDEVVTKVVHAGVGEVVESDVNLAQASDALIIGFNVKSQRSVQQHASSVGVPLYFDDVIYRVMEEVRKRASALLPPKIEKHVKGEAQVAEIFNITIKGRKQRAIAGCRVINGVVEKSSRVRIIRNGEELWEGAIADLKHLKKEISEAKRGMECGMALDGFEDMQPGDIIQAIEINEVARQV